MDKYEKIRSVGRGAYGTVYLCRRREDNNLVIIKQIPIEEMTREERQAALNEVKVLSMLSHPNIIAYYDSFLEDKALMIAMEYAQGGTIFEYLQQRGEHLLNEEEIMHLFVQILLSLQHVHSRSILHRDLKTQNIMLCKKKKVVKVGDFGISKVLNSKSKAHTVRIS
jgi:NIMA (never in mitosis gene a)-related kinase